MTLSTLRFDRTMYLAALTYYGLPAHYRRTFTSVPTTNHSLKKGENSITQLLSCDPAFESRRGHAVWVQVNTPRPHAALTQRGLPKKARNQDIGCIANITFDFELPREPQQAHIIGQTFASCLVQQGLAVEGLPVEDSGAGCHIVLPIPPILVVSEDAARRWNATIATIVRRVIKPMFIRLIEQANLKMDLTGYDISRILSVPGTWRPASPHKEDCEALKVGYLRRWLPPYIGGRYPTRRECHDLATLLHKAYAESECEENKMIHSVSIPVRHEHSNLSPTQWLNSYAARKSAHDRSALFQSLVSATYLKYDEVTVLALKETIHQLSGEKYDGRLDTEIVRSLRVAKQLQKERPRRS